MSSFGQKISLAREQWRMNKEMANVSFRNLGYLMKNPEESRIFISRLPGFEAGKRYEPVDLTGISGPNSEDREYFLEYLVNFQNMLIKLGKVLTPENLKDLMLVSLLSHRKTSMNHLSQLLADHFRPAGDAGFEFTSREK